MGMSPEARQIVAEAGAAGCLPIVKAYGALLRALDDENPHHLLPDVVAGVSLAWFIEHAIEVRELLAGCTFGPPRFLPDGAAGIPFGADDHVVGVVELHRFDGVHDLPGFDFDRWRVTGVYPFDV